MEWVINTQGLSKSFKQVDALKSLDLRVPKHSIFGFLAALGIHFIHIFFYLTLTLLMGVIFNHPAPVIGIPLAFLFSQNFISGLNPSFFKLLPWTLAMPPNNSSDLPVAGALMSGAPVGTFLPVYTTLAASILFVAIALWMFNRQEL